MTSTRADLGGVDDEARGLSLDNLETSVDNALDFFTGVSQADVASGRVDLDKLSREDQIELILDGETSSVFGSSPWAIGTVLDFGAAQEIHEEKGATLVFTVQAGFLDSAQAAVRPVRYALVWDDRVIAGRGTIDVQPLGTSVLIAVANDEPAGRELTLWVSDEDVRTTFVEQGKRQDIETITKRIRGEIVDKNKKDSNPVSDVVNGISTFLTTSTIGGVVVLALAAAVLIVVVRSESFKDVAKVAAKAVK